MPDPFVHLHVASGFSLQYGASHPHVLVERAAEQEMDALALTDRGGTYGAIRFVKACASAGIKPILGVDLAYASGESAPTGAGPSLPRRSPARGGAFREQQLPRVVLLATGKAGWAGICRLVSATHLSGVRGRPVTTPELIAEHCAADVLVLLGPSSTLGRAATEGRADRARQVLARWAGLVPRENLVVELVSHRLPGTAQGWGPGSTVHAARMLTAAREVGAGTVLANAVRYADRLDAPTVDVLDAARSLVPLGSTALARGGPDGFRGNAEGFLKSGKQMAEVAEEICRHAGLGRSGASELLARTRVVAERCALDPRADLGLGEIHFPEFSLGQGRSGPATGDGTGPVAGPGTRADQALRARCEAAIGWRYGTAPRQRIWKRLDDELELVRTLGYASYFLTVGDVVDMVRELGIRVAARGSGAGSLVNYLLGVSGVDPIRHGLLMERFLSPLRTDLPDIDIDVESARRLEVYDAILDRFGAERCVAVSMMETYRVRHAVRDVGAALGMPPTETDAIAKAFPHIRARDARMALRDLPELRSSHLARAEGGLDLFFSLVERLDGLPRHIAMHPCGVLLSDATLLDRTPVEASHAGYPMSQFDKDDVEDLGLLKLDVLGIRMQSAMAHAVAEISRVDGVAVDLEDEAQVPFEDPTTYAMISEAKTLGVFQIESPGQRELVGKSGIDSFSDIIADISLFRPGPVKSDMITPYLDAKQGWRRPSYLHEDLRPILRETHGVVVFHEQVIEIISQFTGVGFAEADEKRRALGSPDGMEQVRHWFFPRCLAQGYPTRVAEQVWRVLEAFASFGFCKAHAAAFALPTFQSAWLKAHWPAHFLAGVLTHDPGMYPKRLILDDARQFGIAVLGLDVNRSEKAYAVERVGDGYGIRLALSEVKGITEAEVGRVVSARPFTSLADLWHRAPVSRPVLERLVLAGGFDDVHGIGSGDEVGRRDGETRRDLLLQVAELDRLARAADRAATRGRGLASRGLAVAGKRASGGGQGRTEQQSPAEARAAQAAARSSSDPVRRDVAPVAERHQLGRAGVWAQASAQSRASAAPRPVHSVQLALELDQGRVRTSGLPEMGAEDRMRAELEILGLDVTQHAVAGSREFLDAIGVVRSKDLLTQRPRAEVLVAGVKVATQTPPIRSGRRVIFLTLDDSTGPVDATFFDDAQGPYAATVFGSWLLLVRGELRRTGRRGVSVRATGCWSLPELDAVWRRDGLAAVHEVMQQSTGRDEAGRDGTAPAGPRRVLVHSSGFRMSPYADVKPAGGPTDRGRDLDVPRRLWHRSPGSSG